MRSAAAVYREAFRKGLAPDPLLTVSEWADAHRILPQKSSAEPGRWRTDRTPYLREIMDAMTPSSPIEEVVLMKGAQIGGTEAILNVIGYVIDHAPGPILAVQPTVELAKRYSRQRVEPLISATPRLAGKVRPARSRDSGNTLLAKDFPGGVLILTGANSAVGLRSMPARYLLLDEIDAYPLDVDEEGDPITLAEVRQETFARRKRLKVSTPTIAGRSRIEAAYLATDQRRYVVPCPSCGHRDYLVFQQDRDSRGHYLVWPPGEPRRAHLVCRANGCVIEEHHKTAMLAAGTWEPTAPAADPKVRGYHLSALYSPLGWLSWAEIARRFETAKDDPTRLRVFVNTVLGETWHDKGEAPEWERLYERRGPYRSGTIPLGGLLLTAGVDVQKDRLVVDVTAWGRGKRSWLVDYLVIPGLYADHSATGPWAQLDALLARRYRHASGVEVPIAVLAIDAGAFTEEVKAWARGHPAVRVLPVKGQAGPGPILGAPTTVDVTIGGRKLKRGMKLWPVYGHTAKVELYGWLRLPGPTDENPEPPPGYCHFPIDLESGYFKQLTAEQLVPRRNKRGYLVQEWNVIPGRENHALDARVYCRAAAAAAGLDRFTEADWRRLEAAVGVTPPPPPPAASPPPASPPPPSPRPRPSLDEVFARARERLRWRR